MRIHRQLLAAGLLVSFGQPAFALDPTGTAEDVRPATAVSGAGGSRTLAIDGQVFMGDVVKTDRRGSAQIKFVDNTKLVVGPDSQVTIDRFVFQSSTTAKSFTLNVAQGTFRFITGGSAKNAYSIKTPTATIGVRGTELDFTVTEAGTHVGLWGGAIRLCDTSVPQRCTIVSGQCSVVIMTPQKQLRRVNSVYERTAMIEALFPYAFRQARLQREFRVESGSCNVQDHGAAPTSAGSSDAPPESPSPPSGGGGGNGGPIIN